ncbi:MAG: DUF502 domain-containing protein [Gemmatimonadetes bacterium]|nr:DUF502 domain-containing protein [Gemmatimonadota bacterium]
MRRLLNYFLRGLVLLAPVGITAWVIGKAFLAIDGWLNLPWPGAGFVATVAIITIFGFVASNLIATQLLSLFDELLQKVPLVRLVYTSAKDLLNAFVGEKRRFKAPVVVTLLPAGNVKCLGFITQESLALLGLPGHVAVYLPQGYAFAGNTLLVPTAQVEALAAEPAEVMAFIVSGGVTAIPGPDRARTENGPAATAPPARLAPPA